MTNDVVSLGVAPGVRMGSSVAETAFDRSTQDVGNVLALEHVNVTVPDQELAALFYVTGLGFTRDPYIDFGTSNMWINVGSQQLHLPRQSAQVLRGTIGLIVPDLDQLARRLARLEKHYGSHFEGTDYRCTPETDGSLLVTCPWGNRLRVHGASDSFGGLSLGMPYVELDVAPGTAPGIARFYDELLGAPTSIVDGGACAAVRIGRTQQLRFRETEAELAPYDGHHVAVYLLNFSAPYGGLLDRDLITIETNEHEYRFQDIVDLDSGTVLATVEHEVRSMFHPLFDRELVNRNADQSLTKYRAGEDAHIGLTHGGRS
ncbi:MAG: hypothetical protein ACI8TP_002849 [Acidimicrobiales bacterium]|jgi:hypothetical protein